MSPQPPSPADWLTIPLSYLSNNSVGFKFTFGLILQSVSGGSVLTSFTNLLSLLYTFLFELMSECEGMTT